ncbi:MAG: protoheme IX farnesyltransferase [Gammaproteobacteria bacterium]|nr:MAG: protoheme IX farnesyltransferase [Gammaproteobacteria bacterium]
MTVDVKEKSYSINLGAYIQLTKPSIIYLLVLTAATAMFLVDGFETNIYKALTGIFGIGLIAASSAAINQILDLEIDGKMKRTDKRPLVSGKIPVINAITFAAILFIIGSFLLLSFNNFLSWALTVATWVFYAFLYTRILKFAGPQNIVIGGLAGAMPPVLGWVALTGSISPLPLLLVAIIFVWTPPHFWALAIDRIDDYENANVPMMPVVKGIEYTKIQILLYSFLLLACSLLPFAIGSLGIFYFVSASSLGLIFIFLAARLMQDKNNSGAIPFFLYSIIYLTILFVSMILDRLI